MHNACHSEVWWLRQRGEIHLCAAPGRKVIMCLSFSFTLHPYFLDFPFLGAFTSSLLSLPLPALQPALSDRPLASKRGLKDNSRCWSPNCRGHSGTRWGKVRNGHLGGVGPGVQFLSQPSRWRWRGASLLGQWRSPGGRGKSFRDAPFIPQR